MQYISFCVLLGGGQKSKVVAPKRKEKKLLHCQRALLPHPHTKAVGGEVSHVQVGIHSHSIMATIVFCDYNSMVYNRGIDSFSYIFTLLTFSIIRKRKKTVLRIQRKRRYLQQMIFQLNLKHPKKWKKAFGTCGELVC